jgi:CrcB protein
VRAFLTIGFCGGYTTFSTFSYETMALLEDGEWSRAGVYITASVLLSLVATFLGLALARQVIVWREHM